jgi:hypothetical protein
MCMSEPMGRALHAHKFHDQARWYVKVQFPNPKLSRLAGPGGDSIRDAAHKERPQSAPGSARTW